MFFTMQHPIAGHILYQQARSMLMIFITVCIVVGMPYLVLWLYGHWGINGYTSVIHVWPYLYGLSFVFGTFVVEYGGYTLYKRRVHLDDTNIDEMIQPLLDKAGLKMPHIVFIDENVGIAAASQSLRFGGKLLFCREKMEALTKPQFMAVAAHEIAHLKHGDLYMTWLLFVMGKALDNHKFVLYMALCYTFALGTWSEFGFFAMAWACLKVASIAFGLVSRAFTRAREYLADAGGVALIGWNRRHDLIDALKAISKGDSRVPKQLEWLFTHPVVENREAALKLRPDERRILARAFA